MREAADITLIVLAAGRGTRMRNSRPKVLHPLAGRSLIAHVVALADAVAARDLVAVLAPGMDDVAAAVRAEYPGAQIAIQERPLGTGHALAAAGELWPKTGTTVVLFGDTPLITAGTIAALAQAREAADAAVVVMGMHPPGQHKYGRLRFAENGDLADIVEHAHADDALRATAMCNSGVMAIDAKRLARLIGAIVPQPSNGEYYLTDIVGIARRLGWVCRAIEVDWREGHGVNSQAQLAEANALFQQRRRADLLAAGVVMTAPETVQLAFDTRIAPGAEIEANVVFGPGVTVAESALVRSFSHVEGASIGPGAVVGPYARLRPGSRLGENARIGNFVETKNAEIQAGAKANHLTYLGDCTVGQGSNIGAGTITCNYDGFNKWRTEIGTGTFIGSNTALVAPLTVGDNVIVAAGSTITTDIPDQAVALARGEQQTRPGTANALRRRLQRKKVGSTG